METALALAGWVVLLVVLGAPTLSLVEGEPLFHVDLQDAAWHGLAPATALVLLLAVCFARD